MFDVASVLISLPIVLPACLVIGLAVRLTSQGPVLFRQRRMGCQGRTFTIFKFRTMPVHREGSHRPAVTTRENQQFTPIGAFLRRWKIDELPQLINVLRGDMSLVGPRPKLVEHQKSKLYCRPGITGAATVVFACEEIALADIPSHQLDKYYHAVVLPAKRQLDLQYMAASTFRSDLKLIFQSVFRKWSPETARAFIDSFLGDTEDSENERVSASALM